MKKTLLILIFVFFKSSLSAQSLINFGVIPPEIQSNEPIKTADLLKSIKWENLKEFASTNSNFTAEETLDGMTSSYSMYNLITLERFYLSGFNGNVYEFFSEFVKGNRPTSTTYFDKTVYENYIDFLMPELPKEFKLSGNESIEFYKDYYNFIRTDNNDEYGFTCEYGTIGSQPYKRNLVRAILKSGRTDLLKKLIYYPNIQVQLYAIDALIYNDYKLKKLEQEIQELKNQINNAGENEESITGNLDIMIIRLQYKNEKILKNGSLNKDEWDYIYKLRESGKEVVTCGNSGSFKKYKTDISELLTDDVISKIPKKYENLELFDLR
jgi:hypothetical protein